MRFSNFIKRDSDPVGLNGTKSEKKSDEAIIHQTVPDEVLYPDGRNNTSGSNDDWLNAVSVEKEKATSSTSPSAESTPEWVSSRTTTAARGHSKASPVKQPTAFASEREPNPAAAARPRNPVGWLVVVEGPGLGEWFVLEKGTSHIGSSDGQTVRLNFDDPSVAPTRHASLSYDSQTQTFAIAGETNLRVNGVEAAREILRDGDVFTVGQTSLRLVALCSPNFHWPAQNS